MSRPRVSDGCRTEGCQRPHHAGGFCKPCYKRDKRGFRPTNPKSVVREPDSELAPSGRDPDPQTGSYVVESGGIRRTSDGAFQMIGVVCPDCRGEVIYQSNSQLKIHSGAGVGWCHSPHHPIFDSTGRLIQLTPAGRS